MRDVLDMLNFVEAQIQARQTPKLIQTFHMANEIVVKIEFLQRARDIRGEINSGYLVLSQT